MSEEKRPVGRPKKNPGDRRRWNLTFRVRDSLLERLRAFAAAEQRSVSEVVEAIVEGHFTRASMLDDLRQVLNEYGPRSQGEQANRLYARLQTDAQRHALELQRDANHSHEEWVDRVRVRFS